MPHHNHSHHHEHEDHAELFATFTIEKKPKSLVSIKGEIPVEELQMHEAHVLSGLGQDIEMKGFRKGHVPEAMVRKQIGEMALFTEVCEHTLSHLYPEMLEHFALDVIGRPEIHAEKMAPGNPFGFRIEVAVLPPVTLPDYKKITKDLNTKKEESNVTDAEVTEAIEKIQRQKLAYERMQAKAQVAKDGLTLPTPETVETEEATEEDSAKLPLPALTDDYVKTLGAFDSVETFKKQITEHLVAEKKNEVMSKHRGALTDAIIEGSTIDLPDILIQSELGQMFGQMEEDLKRAGLTLDGYLEHVKQSKDDLVREWSPAAEKRAKTQLILNEIAKQEHIEPKAEDVEREVGQLISQYKDADPVRVRVYIASVLQNNEVMKFLETQ